MIIGSLLHLASWVRWLTLSFFVERGAAVNDEISNLKGVTSASPQKLSSACYRVRFFLLVFQVLNDGAPNCVDDVAEVTS